MDNVHTFAYICTLDSNHQSTPLGLVQDVEDRACKSLIGRDYKVSQLQLVSPLLLRSQVMTQIIKCSR